MLALGLGAFYSLPVRSPLQRQLLDAVLMDTLEMVFFEKNYFRTLNLDAIGTDFIWKILLYVNKLDQCNLP